MGCPEVVRLHQDRDRRAERACMCGILALPRSHGFSGRPYTKYGFSLVALEYDRALLKDRAMRHAIHLVRFNNNQFELSATPMDVRYVRSSSPAT
jgi:hypothetical protein